MIAELGLSKMSNEDKYLGFQILKQGNRSASHKFLVEKFDGKLIGWKRHFLSHAGRTILIQSVLALLPIYFMVVSLIPKEIINKLNR